MKSGWLTLMAAVVAVLGLLVAGASAKDAVKAPGGEEKGTIVQIDGKAYRLVPVSPDKPVKEGAEVKSPKGEPSKDGQDNPKLKGEKAKDAAGDKAEGGKGKFEGGKGEKVAKGGESGSLAGKKVILRVDDREYVAIIVAELTGKGPGEKIKGEGEKARGGEGEKKPVKKAPAGEGGDR